MDHRQPQRSLWTPALYLRAWRFAARAHAGQIWKGSGLPYIVHIGMVAAETAAALGREGDRDGDLAIQAALLHDVLEDTGVAEGEMRALFGDAVTRAVRSLTKDPALPKERRMADSLARIAAAGPEAAMVKLADRIANLEPPPPDWDAAKIESYRAEARTIHAALAHASPHLGARLLERIEAYGRA